MMKRGLGNDPKLRNSQDNEKTLFLTVTRKEHAKYKDKTYFTTILITRICTITTIYIYKADVSVIECNVNNRKHKTTTSSEFTM